MLLIEWLSLCTDFYSNPETIETFDINFNDKREIVILIQYYSLIYQ